MTDTKHAQGPLRTETCLRDAPARTQVYAGEKPSGYKGGPLYGKLVCGAYSEADATEIARRWNAHEDMLASLKGATAMLAFEAQIHREQQNHDKAEPVQGMVDDLRKTIAKAGGGA